MKNRRDVKMFNENINASSTYEDIKSKISLDTNQVVGKRNSSKIALAFGLPILASSIMAVSIVGAVTLNNPPIPSDFIRPVEYIKIYDAHESVDVIGKDISLLPEDEEHPSYVLTRRDYGLLINNREEMDLFVNDYSVNEGSEFYSKLDACDNQYFENKSIVTLLYYEEEGVKWSFEELVQFIHPSNSYSSGLAANAKRIEDTSSDITIYTAIVELSKETLNNLEFKLTSNIVATFWHN